MTGKCRKIRVHAVSVISNIRFREVLLFSSIPNFDRNVEELAPSTVTAIGSFINFSAVGFARVGLELQPRRLAYAARSLVSSVFL